jgi:hypothetical protein
LTSDTFTSFFTSSGNTTVDQMTILEIVGSGGTNGWPRKAARDLIAAYPQCVVPRIRLYVRTTTILSDWATAVAGGTSGFHAFHLKCAAATSWAARSARPMC